MKQPQQPDKDGNKDQGGLTNRNVTRPNPPESPEPGDRPPVRRGLEDSNITQPTPPKNER
jgi:hypothetical protein